VIAIGAIYLALGTFFMLFAYLCRTDDDRDVALWQWAVVALTWPLGIAWIVWHIARN
jgi:hypothetical protein